MTWTMFNLRSRSIARPMVKQKLQCTPFEARDMPAGLAAVVEPGWFAPVAAQQRLMAADAGSEWIVTLSPEAAARADSPAAAAQFLTARDGVNFTVERGLGGRGLLVVSATGRDDAVVAAFRQQPGVVAFEKNEAISFNALPNDPDNGKLWALDNLGQTGGVVDADIDWPEALAISAPRGKVVVGVVDTGVDLTHPDLVANLWTNPGEVAGDGLDNDGNGFIDDVHGYDFVGRDGTPQDENIHGTHVAGIIAATPGNGVGITGVAGSTVQIMALRVLDANGTGSLANSIAAVNYATMMRQRGVNIRATNHSYGAAYGGLAAERDAFAAAGQAGILTVAAAGNSGTNNDQSPFFPASYNLPTHMSVASTTDRDELSSFSNTGAGTVQIAAPGSAIFSTVPGGYATLSGTSMASPHIAGAAGLVFANRPDLGPAAVRDLLMAGADRLAALNGRVTSGGRLNVARTLSLATNTPLDDHGNTRGTATVMPRGAVVTMSGAITPNTDRDVFRFTLDDRRRVNISVLTTRSGLQPRLTLTDANGRTKLSTAASASGKPAGLSIRLEPGTYYITVSARRLGAADTGAYRLVTALDGALTLKAKYADLNGSSGQLGAARGDLTRLPRSLGSFQQYQHGRIYDTTRAGVHFVGGAIYKSWKGLGAHEGAFGLPISDPRDATEGFNGQAADPTGRVQYFEGGVIYHSSRSGVVLQPYNWSQSQAAAVVGTPDSARFIVPMVPGDNLRSQFAPKAPSNLQAHDITPTSVRLTWIDNSSNESEFALYMKDSSSEDWYPVAYPEANETSTVYEELDPSSEYQFVLTAADDEFEESDYSNAVPVTTPSDQPVAPTVPAAPRDLQATAATTSSVSLVWVDASTDEESFRIERSRAGGAWETAGSTGKDAVTFLASGLDAGVSYQFRVLAVNGVGPSLPSPAITQATNPIIVVPPPMPPSAPTNVQASGVTRNSANLTWTDTSSNETGFEIVITGGGSTRTIATAADVTSQTITDLTPNTPYTVVVRAVNAIGAAASEPASFTTMPVDVVDPIPAAPHSLVASNITTTTLTLTWVDASTNETEFRVARSDDNGVTWSVTSVPANTTRLDVTGLTPVRTYVFEVRAANASGVSPASARVSPTTLTPVPLAPTGVNAVNVGTRSLDLIWNAAPYATSYKVFQGGTEIATVNGTSVPVSNLNPGTEYGFTVKALNASGVSATSTEARATTGIEPPLPIVNLQAASAGMNAIDLQWSAATNATSIKIFRSTDGTNFIEIDTVAGNATSFRSPNLSAGTTYWYRVVAVNGAGAAAASNVASATTSPPPVLPPDVPGNLRLENRFLNALDIKWNPVANATGIKIFRSTDNVNFIEIDTVAGDRVSFRSPNLDSGRTYWYKVMAVNSGGESGLSNWTVGTTTSVPAVPGNLRLENRFQHALDIKWNPVANASGIKIFRSTDNVNFIEIDTVAGDRVSFRSPNLDSGRTYWYKVKAVGDGGESGFSNWTVGTTL